jgi:hypothetical protein
VAGVIPPEPLLFAGKAVLSSYVLPVIFQITFFLFLLRFQVPRNVEEVQQTQPTVVLKEEAACLLFQNFQSPATLSSLKNLG